MSKSEEEEGEGEEVLYSVEMAASMILPGNLPGLRKGTKGRLRAAARGMPGITRARNRRKGTEIITTRFHTYDFIDFLVCES